MNRLLAKISLATAATAIGAFGFSAVVLAGEGGVAGAAAFTIRNFTGNDYSISGSNFSFHRCRG